MVVKLSVTAALDARDTKLREESIYLDPGSLYRNRSSQLGVAADTIYSEVDSRTMARQRDIAFVQDEERFEKPMTAAELAEKAKASSRGIMLNPNSMHFQNVQAQSTQQIIARIESAQPQNQGMVTLRIEDQTPSFMRANQDQRTFNVSISRSRAGSTVTPAVAEKAELRVHRDAAQSRRSSNSSRRRSQPTESTSNPLVLGAFTAAVMDSRSYREPSVEGFIADLVKSREPKENAVEGILSRREAAKNSSELMALSS